MKVTEVPNNANEEIQVENRFTVRKVFTFHLGSTHPWPITVLMEPFSSKDQKCLTFVFATTTKICTEDRFTWVYTQMVLQLTKTRDLHALLLVEQNPFRFHVQRSSISSSLECHPFSGHIHSAGEFVDIPWRFPTFGATVLLSWWIHTLYGTWMSEMKKPDPIDRVGRSVFFCHLGTLTWRLVHPTSPVLLTRHGPLKALSILSENMSKGDSLKKSHFQISSCLFKVWE